MIDNLDWSFMYGGFENGSLPPSRRHEKGNSGEDARHALRILDRFLGELDLDSMASDAEHQHVGVVGTSGRNDVVAVQGLVDTSRGNTNSTTRVPRIVYAGYVGSPEVSLTMGAAHLDLRLGVPCGERSCSLEWVDPFSGERQQGVHGVVRCTGLSPGPLPAWPSVAFKVRC